MNCIFVQFEDGVFPFNSIGVHIADTIDVLLSWKVSRDSACARYIHTRYRKLSSSLPRSFVRTVLAASWHKCGQDQDCVAVNLNAATAVPVEIKVYAAALNMSLE